MIGLIWLVMAVTAIALAQDSPDWESQQFDFADPVLNFSTMIARGASGGTVPMGQLDLGFYRQN